MRVLFLGPAGSPLAAWLAERETSVTTTAAPIDADAASRCDALVSHGYRHIIPAAVLAASPGPAVNLHIAYLPWNRGADPNLWSILTDTPKGVTIHHLDPGVDTGDIVAQERVELAPGDTLATSYARLQDCIQALFRAWWPRIRTGDAPRIPQRGEGSVHRVRDRERVEHLLVRGWDTPVAGLLGADRALS